jgi:hypothetical protein
MANTTFSDLKKKKKSTDILREKMEKAGGQKEFKGDERYWKLTLDKTGVGAAVIRFLPAPMGEEDEFVRICNHGFKSTSGKWFIHNCPTTIKKDCPVCDLNTELWNTNIEANQNIARNRKRKLQYISNILVITDPANRENEGKVFLFSYGKKIFTKIMDATKVDANGIEERVPIDPFDFWEGADFILKSEKVDGYVNYEKSSFKAKSEIPGGEDRLKQIWESEYSLKDLISDDKFESYEELSKRLQQVLGIKSENNSNESVSKQVNSVVKSKVLTKEEENDDIPFVTDDDSDDIDLEQLEEMMKD